MRLYADEDFTSKRAVEELRRLGHDVLTAQEDGRRAASDENLLARAHELGRVVVTFNGRHFMRLHGQGNPHSGIISATQDPGKHLEIAARVHAALDGMQPGCWHIRVNRPNPGRPSSD